MAELGDGRSWGMGGTQEGFFFFHGFLFFIPIVYFFAFRFNTVVCSANNGKKKIFACYLNVASRAY